MGCTNRCGPGNLHNHPRGLPRPTIGSKCIDKIFEIDIPGHNPSSAIEPGACSLIIRIRPAKRLIPGCQKGEFVGILWMVAMHFRFGERSMRSSTSIEDFGASVQEVNHRRGE